MFHARSPKRNQALYTPPSVIHVQVHPSLAAKREEARRKSRVLSPRVARDPRLYSHDDERSSDGRHTFSKASRDATESLSSCSAIFVIISLLLYHSIPAYFSFPRKMAKFLRQDYLLSLFNFFFFFFVS